MSTHSALAIATVGLAVLAAALVYWGVQRHAAEGGYQMANSTFAISLLGVSLAVCAAAAGVGWLATAPAPPPGSRAAFCQKHECIGDWEHARGSRVRCADGAYSFSGGIQGACSSHGGLGGPSRSLFGSD